MFAKLQRNWLELALLSILFVVTVLVRFPDLGYSDYIGDEHKAFFQPDEGQSAWGFFMEQRKGPMQFAVSYVPYLFTHDWRNELAQRLPFTIFNTASVFVLYAFIKRLTQNTRAAFLASFLLSINGFVVGFSRIAQYQSLNLFFSFLALHFYVDFFRPTRWVLRNTLLGTLFFSLSLLAHWDGIFVLVPIMAFLVCFLRNKLIHPKEKVKVILANLAFGVLLLLPFLGPYISYQLGHSSNLQYFERRVNVIEESQYNSDKYDFLIKLYNPFFLIEFLAVFGIAALLFIKRTWLYVLWSLVNLGIFAVFVKKPGTHIYNFLIPLIILAAFGVAYLIEKFPVFLKAVLGALVAALLVFFVYQTYQIFIDNNTEYPWRREELLGGRLKTPEYKIEDKLPLFGFPMARNWNEINSFINGQNAERGEDFGYITNEAKTISEWYMDTRYKADHSFYAVGIKRPLSFVNDWNFPQVGGKVLIHEIFKGDEAVVRIYRVE